MNRLASARTYRLSASWTQIAIGLVAVLALLVLTGIGLELSRSFERNREISAEIEKSHQTRAQIAKVFSLLQDAETGQRGYVITGERRFLQPYESAERQLGHQLATLNTFYATRPEQRADMALLERLVVRKQATMSAAIEAGRTQGREAGLSVVTAGAGKAAMDDIRGVVDRMVQTEAVSLDALRKRADARATATERMVTLLFVLLISAVAGAAYLGWRYLRSRQIMLRQVQAAAARQTAIFDSAVDAILTLNPSGSIETMNRSATRMFGWTADELMRRDLSVLLDFVDGQETSFLRRVGFGAEGGTDGVVREFTAKRRNGQTFPVDVALSLMPLPSGDHLVAVVRDISERRRVEEMKHQFVSTVSHELRTPLTSIAGSLGLLAGGAGGALPDGAMRLISIAHSNSQRLVRLINDILDVEKLESGQMKLDLAPLDLRDVAIRSMESVSGMASSMGVELRLRDGHPAPVRGDSDRLVQVVVNLLSNAVKFSPRGGEVKISVQPEVRIVRLSVRDYGPGIPDEFRARIFSKFAQADASDSRAKGGTGLGLVIAREIAERHGGRLWFESAIGEGATFHLDLPMAPEDGGDGPVLPGPRLLIVEDDAEAAKILRTMLLQDGFVADVAPTAREALSAIRGDGYSAVLIDLQLPDADGIGLIRTLREDAATRDLPVVVVSADVARGKARGQALEVIDWMEKPFDQDRLRGAVSGILARLPQSPARVLHVEDDPDVLAVTASALAGVAEVTAAASLAAARAVLAEIRPDLVVLDLGLPDGSGLDLLSDLDDGNGRTIPVVIYSAQELDAGLGDRVEAVLVKSRTSLATLVRTVRRLTR